MKTRYSCARVQRFGMLTYAPRDAAAQSGFATVHKPTVTDWSEREMLRPLKRRSISTWRDAHLVSAPAAVARRSYLLCARKKARRGLKLQAAFETFEGASLGRHWARCGLKMGLSVF